MTWWQHLPETLDPIAFSIGFLSVYWYALFFLLGFFASLWFSFSRATESLSKDEIFDLFILSFFGALVGGRLGFALFYYPSLFLEQPLVFLSPYDFTQSEWIGISGMSFHGALVGVIGILAWFVWRREKPFFAIADILALAAPIALFFGRLGNFWNGELYGRVTEKMWGMYFSGTEPLGMLRHPSALYEALLEGVLLFGVLFLVHRRIGFSGGVASLFLILYGTFRFIIEYVREPDQGVSFFLGYFTRGQALSISMFLIGILLFAWLKSINRDKIPAKA